MKPETMYALLTGIFALLIQSVEADLPVHCVRHQIVGEWTFLLGPPSKNRLDCGHRHPDREDAQPHLSQVHSVRNVTVHLLEPNEAAVGKAKGNWTMIYDEGFEVDSDDGLEFFAFSKFQLLAPEMRQFSGQSAILSECHKTQVGWYRNTKEGVWGCFYGHRTAGRDKFAAVQTTLGMKTSPSYGKTLSRVDMQNVVNELNAQKLSWTATVNPRFVGKSMRQMNMFAGLQRSAKEPGSRKMSNLQLRGPESAKDAEARKKLPTSFDWRDVNSSSWLTPNIDQGDCGSCYVIATMRMLTARHRIAKNDPTMEAFSVDFPLHCSEYNQGCKGGYPFLVSKWARDVGVLPESCGSYNPEINRCSVKCDFKTVKKHRVSSFQYIGGYYGGGTELGMMQEVHKNGPVVVSLEPGNDFMYYNKGVYRSTPVRHSEWVKVDHSVLLVGWGEEAQSNGKPLKYWIVQNSWGADWGEDGFFRIERGTDDSGIEAEAFSAEVIEEPKALDAPFVQLLERHKRSGDIHQGSVITE